MERVIQIIRVIKGGILGVKSLTVSDEDKILVIAPHPDDESIGCGGLLNAYSNQIDIVIMTDGARGAVNINMREMKMLRKKEFENAMRNVNISNYLFLDYPDGELVYHPECLDNIYLRKYTKIFVPHHSELHADHKALFDFLIKKITEERMDEIEIYQYETRAAINENVTALDISMYIHNKLEMVRQYKSQLVEYDYACFVEALSKYHACKEHLPDRYLEVYVRYERENENRDGIDSRLLTDYRLQNELMKLWIEVSIEGKNIHEYISNRFKDVAIYGYGYWGKLLYKDIINAGGKIKFVIDKEAATLKENGIIFISPDIVENVDVLIVSNLFGGETIKDNMLSCGYKHVITLRDILIQMKAL